MGFAGIGALIGGLGSLAGGIGGLFGKGGGPDIGAQQQFSMQQLQMQQAFQREMAQESIRWRVNDAKLAGISPLVALGAPTFSPSTQVGGVDYGASRSSGPDFSGLSRAGQALGDIYRTATQKDTADAILATQQANAVKQGQLTDADIALKGAQAAYWAKRATDPPYPTVNGGPSNNTGPMSGQSSFGALVGSGLNRPPELTTAQPGSPGTVSGRAAPADQAFWTRDGTVEVQPAAGTPASQGDIFNSGLNALRNRLPAAFQPRNDPMIMAKIREQYPNAVGYQREGFGYFRPVFPGGDVLRPDGTIGPMTRSGRNAYRD